jgi:hypothetical protein
VKAYGHRCHFGMSGHGHSHGGVACAGHGEQEYGHGDGHGAHGAHAAAAHGHGHGHSHGGVACTGHHDNALEGAGEVAEDGGDVTFEAYRDETQLPAIMGLISSELSEPYSIYTYR